MKSLKVYLLAVAVLATGISAPVLADEVRHEVRQADREADRASDAQVRSDVNAAEGHPIRSELDQIHADHEANKAARHDRRAVRHSGW